MNLCYYVIKRSKENQFYFTFHAPNHEIILTSETYSLKRICAHAINLLQHNGNASKIIDES
jgi:uncharacterized protein YegP (UPF0339 family)